MAESTSFLSLPGELRNHVYNLYASMNKPTALTIIGCQSGFQCVQPLAQVSCQIRHEYNSFAVDFEDDFSQVTRLTMVVTDFEFKELETHFEDLEDSMLSLKEVRVKLIFTEACLDIGTRTTMSRMHSQRVWYWNFSPTGLAHR